MMNELDLKRAQETFKAGHFWNPDNEDLWNVKYSDIPNLNFNDLRVVKAIQSRTIFQVYPYAELVAKAHGRAPNFDGELGPAVIALLDVERCLVPDYAPPIGVDFSFSDDPALEQVCKQMQADLAEPAVGSGNWARCHDIGNFHSAVVKVDQSGIRGHLQPLFIQVLRNVQKAYGQMGQWFVFVEDGKDLLTGESNTATPNIDFSFVSRSSGWIGLAIVGQNQTCSSRIWCKYLSSYQGADVVTEWTTLIKHELGHNCDRGHTRGGVMNSSIVRGLPILWVPNDPSYRWLQDRFGGEPVVKDEPTPPVPPTPGTIEERVKNLESQQAVDDVKFAVHDSLLKHLLETL
jgi:hypothetical protein